MFSAYFFSLILPVGRFQRFLTLSIQLVQLLEILEEASVVAFRTGSKNCTSARTVTTGAAT
jgi:hypothetical protein